MRRDRFRLMAEAARLAGLALAVLWAGLLASITLGHLEARWSPLSNALSDLGVVGAPTRPVFNATLAASAVLLAATAASLRDRLLLTASLLESLVAVIDESLGLAHYLIAVALFAALAAYVWLRCSRIASAVMIASWIPYLARLVAAAPPELLNAAIASACVARRAGLWRSAS